MTYNDIQCAEVHRQVQQRERQYICPRMMTMQIMEYISGVYQRRHEGISSKRRDSRVVSGFQLAVHYSPNVGDTTSAFIILKFQ